jgi:RND family efflux transporter MFP subunit
MIMIRTTTPKTHRTPYSQVLAVGVTLFGFTAHAAVAASDPPALDCLLEPYEVVEVSSAVEGVIDQIHVDRNDIVKKGQLLVELDSDVERTQVQLARTRAGLRTNIELRATELAFHERAQKRLEELYKTNTISLQIKEQADTDTSKSRLQLRNAKDSQRLAELELAKAEAILELRTMRSPIDGVVVARNKVAGEFVEDQSILRLAQLDPLKVEVIVPVAMFGTIREGMQVEVTPQHYGNTSHTATVTLVDRVIDPASGTFDVRAELPNPNHTIPSGLRCTVQFLDKPRDSSSYVDLSVPLQLPEPEIAQSTQADEKIAQDRMTDEKIAEAKIAEAKLIDAKIAEAEMAEAKIAKARAAEPKIAKAMTAKEKRAAELAAEVEQAEMKLAEIMAAREKRAGGEKFEKAAMAAAVPECSAQRNNIIHSYRILADPDANNTDTVELETQLRLQGIDDLYVVTAGKNRGQIALGLYSQKPYAEERLAELTVLGFQVEMDVSSKVETEAACNGSLQYAGSDAQ